MTRRKQQARIRSDGCKGECKGMHQQEASMLVPTVCQAPGWRHWQPPLVLGQGEMAIGVSEQGKGKAMGWASAEPAGTPKSHSGCRK